MIPIFICEDQPVQLHYFVETIKNFVMIQELDMQLELAASDPFEVIRYVEANEVQGGLYFLDIDLSSSINGIDLGVAIRQKDPTAKIVFVTTHDELAPLTFRRKVETLDYILKSGEFASLRPQIEECVQVAFQRSLDRRKIDKQLFSLAVGSRHIHLALSDLYFIETLHPHKLIVHTVDSQYQFYGKLNQLEKEYPQMMRVHKAFLINPENVQEIDFSNKQIFFAEGIACSLSGSKVKAIKERMAKTLSD